MLFRSRVFGPLAWGWLADLSGRRVLLMRVAVGFGLLMSMVTFLNDQSASHLIVCLVLLNLSISGLIPMSDVQAMDVCKGDAGAYGRVRLFGSLGFILAVLGFGFWADHLGFNAFPVWVFVCLGLAWVSTWCFKEPKEYQAKTIQKHSSIVDTLQLLVPSDLRVFWLASLFMILAHGVFYSFFSLYLMEFGYSESAIGGLWSNVCERRASTGSTTCRLPTAPAACARRSDRSRRNGPGSPWAPVTGT